MKPYLSIRSLEERLRELRESNDRLQQVVASSGAVIYKLRVVENTAILEWISENVTRILGYEIKEAYSPRWWGENLHPEDHERIMGTAAADRSAEMIHEYRFRHKDG